MSRLYCSLSAARRVSETPNAAANENAVTQIEVSLSSQGLLVALAKVRYLDVHPTIPVIPRGNLPAQTCGNAATIDPAVATGDN